VAVRTWIVFVLIGYSDRK